MPTDCNLNNSASKLGVAPLKWLCLNEWLCLEVKLGLLKCL